ncbi:MAG: hypothetical protein QOD56_2084 [Gammaproteobacteria bacterium]|jgi:UrcA family protein|nr:hypothetical protein [Gammaproteobacteria bacterium]
MTTETSLADASVSRPTITWMMVLCGIVGTAAAGAVSAATTDDAPPSISVKYDPQSLLTDDGVRVLYHRLEVAAEQVCPEPSTASRLVNGVIKQCREQAVARAVHQIGDPRLVAVNTARAHRG